MARSQSAALDRKKLMADPIMASDALKTAVADEEKFLRGEGRILVRPSGTEALIRVMVEAKTESVAQLVAERLVKVIRSV